MNTPKLAQGARLTAVALKNHSGEEVGKVIEWLMDVEQGRVIYVVARFDDAESDAYFAIPWALMKADLQAGGYLVDQDKVKERNLRINHNSLNELALDKGFLDRLFDAYQLDKYWIEQNQSTPANQPSDLSSSQSSSGESSDSGINSGPAREEEASASNAEAGEGKGYGG